jgi:Acetoacetate decarboxylase (ADC)
MTDKPAPTPKLVLPPSADNSLPRLPAYVEHGGEIACRHPADGLDSRMYGFVVQANRDCLDAYCDRCFNAPTMGEQQWRAISDHALLNFVDIPKMGSTDPLDDHLGYTHEREAAIWFPVYEPRLRLLAWAIPYMFVDSHFALAGGREVYGFPKQLGALTIPRDRQIAPASLKLRVDTFAKYKPTAKARNHRVITVRRIGGGSNRLDSEGSLPGEAFHGVIRGFSSVVEPKLLKGDLLGWLANFGRDEVPDVIPNALFFVQLVEQHSPMLLLKQFRDAHVPGGACYQALVLADLRMTDFRAGGLLPDDYEVKIARLDGEPICRELGIAKASRPHTAFWLDFDFYVELGDILWEAPIG